MNEPVVNHAVTFKDMELYLYPYVKNPVGVKQPIPGLNIEEDDDLDNRDLDIEDEADLPGFQVRGFADDPRAAVGWAPLTLTNQRRVSADGVHSVSFINSDRPGMLSFMLLYESRSLDVIYDVLVIPWERRKRRISPRLLGCGYVQYQDQACAARLRRHDADIRRVPHIWRVGRRQLELQHCIPAGQDRPEPALRGLSRSSASS